MLLEERRVDAGRVAVVARADVGSAARGADAGGAGWGTRHVRSSGGPWYDGLRHRAGAGDAYGDALTR